MHINVSQNQLRTDNAAMHLVDVLQANSNALRIDDAQLYYQFPIVRDLEDSLLVAPLLLLSKRHGLIIFGTSSVTTRNIDAIQKELFHLDDTIDNVLSQLYARLLRNKNLGNVRKGLSFNVDAILYAPYLEHQPETELQSTLILNEKNLIDHLADSSQDPIDSALYAELKATLEGAKGLVRSNPRIVPDNNSNSKGHLANLIESEIASFDERQKIAYMAVPDGLHRIRGLAGSGKTVVLAMKAAITHLKYPEATIVYTFYTRSLYQHVQRLITRFYRQFDDKDPDWSRLHILHAWGGQTSDGVYYRISKINGTNPLTYSTAVRQSKEPFDYACTSLLNELHVPPRFDYCFIDEGQDFPASFFQLCIKATVNGRVTFAYDDLQTIFQAATPTLEAIIGNDGNGNPLIELTEDTVLYKCYRNPREVLICAHALGFGLYSPKIVQMLENKEQWEDIGYKVVSGEFIEGSPTIITRPDENSIDILSKQQTPNELVSINVHQAYSEEISSVIKGIKQSLEDGLRPEDIIVIVVDSVNAKKYLIDIEAALTEAKIECNNIHIDPYSTRDFHKEDSITLTTIHKAKGNEGFMIFVLGVDALFIKQPGVRERNLLFTAITRAKGWVRISGVGAGAELCANEIQRALENLPELKFNYPSDEQLKILKRDLTSRDIKKSASIRKLYEAVSELPQDEVQRLILQRFKTNE